MVKNNKTTIKALRNIKKKQFVKSVDRKKCIKGKKY